MKRLSYLVLAFAFLPVLPLTAQPQLEYYRKHIMLGYYSESIPGLYALAQANHREKAVWTVLGEAYLGEGVPDSAEIVARKALEIDDEYVPAYIVLARAHIDRQRVADAFGTLRKGLKENPNNTLLLNQLGYAYLAADSLDRAIVAFSKAKEGDPDNPVILAGLADAYMRQGVSALAVTLLEKARKSDSLNIEILSKLARAYIKEQRYVDAGQVYESVLGLDSTNATALLDLGKILYAGRQYANAADMLGKYLALKPGHPDVVQLRMDALFFSQQAGGARDAAEVVLRHDPKNVRALRVAARCSVALDDPAHAVEYYTRLAALDSLTAEEEVRLGRAYVDQKNDSLAVPHFLAAIARDTTQTELYGELGTLYMRMQRFDLAADAFRARFTRDPSSVTSYLNYALCSMQLGRWDEARQSLRTAIALKDDYPPSYWYLARVLMQSDSLHEARREYEEFIARVGEDPEGKYAEQLAESYRMIGYVQLVDKRFPEAVESLKKSIKVKNNSSQAHLWLAQAYALLQKKDDAVREFKRVLDIDPKNKEAKKGLELLGP